MQWEAIASGQISPQYRSALPSRQAHGTLAYGLRAAWERGPTGLQLTVERHRWRTDTPLRDQEGLIQQRTVSREDLAVGLSVRRRLF